MKKLLPLVMLLMTASAANAGGLVTKHASSVQLSVDAARSTAVRIGDSYSASGTNISVTTMGGVGGAGTYTVNTAGDPWSLSESYTVKDTIPASAVTTGDTPNFSNVTSYTAGTAGSLAGTIDNTHTLTVTAGGAGTSATGQFVTEITVID
jgi:lipoprotein-anchoring transpeptidase ErfK/SrfK